jgi:hypothetical protein
MEHPHGRGCQSSVARAAPAILSPHCSIRDAARVAGRGMRLAVRGLAIAAVARGMVALQSQDKQTVSARAPVIAGAVSPRNAIQMKPI